MDAEDQLKPVFIKKNKNLSRPQIRTLNVLRGRARVDSEAATASIERKLGIGSAKILLDYISKCQLNINFNDSLFKIFSEDTHYRSVYETDTKGARYNSSRNVAEDRIFLDLYKSVTAFERPKYGSIDIHNQPGKDALQYGNCYFVLDDNVQIRTTITKCDSFTTTPIGVLDYPLHVLDELSKDELLYIYSIANGSNESSGKSTKNSYGYKEVQYHGPISFIEDIMCVCIPESVVEDFYFIKFIEKFNLNYCTY